MTRDEAKQVISQVCTAWRGTIAEGELVKEAYIILTADPEPPTDPEP